MPLLFIVSILLSQLAPAETWVEILEKSDFHEDHPGRHAKEITPNSPALEYLEKRRDVLEKIIKGTPATIPIENLDLDSWTNMMLAQVGFGRLTKFHAEQQEWEKVFQLLKFSGRVRNRIIESEPTLVWFLLAIYHGNIPFTLLDSVARIEDQKEKAVTFKRLRDHWPNLLPSRMDFLKTRKGETKYVMEMAKDFKSYLKTTMPNLDEAPWFWKEEPHHKLTLRELLDFPIDNAATKKKFLDELNEEFAWIKSGKPIKDLPRLTRKLEVNDLDFYRNHPNGLVEIFDVNYDNMGLDLAESVDSLTKRALTREIAWRWLEEELTGKKLTQESDIIALLTPMHKKEALAHQMKISPSNRTITTPPEEVLGFDVENITKVPNLFLE